MNQGSGEPGAHPRASGSNADTKRPGAHPRASGPDTDTKHGAGNGQANARRLLVARGRRLRRTAWLWLLIAPALLTMVAFVFVPILSALAYSFYSWEGMSRGAFIWFENFRAVLVQEPFAGWTRNALAHNVIVFVTLMVVQNGTAFFLAYALFKEPYGFKLHRITVFLPVVLSTIIVGFLWKLFYHPIFGLVNQLLFAVGLDGLATAWLGQASTALWAIIFANAWHFVGFPTLIFLAAMQRIPQDYIDAARVEGAGEGALLARVIWPLVAPAATIIFILTFIGAFNWFELPYVMAGLDGSPYGATDVLGLYFYRTAFGNQSAGVLAFGKGSALAVLIFLLIASVAAVATIYLRRREVEL